MSIQFKFFALLFLFILFIYNYILWSRSLFRNLGSTPEYQWKLPSFFKVFSTYDMAQNLGLNFRTGMHSISTLWPQSTLQWWIENGLVRGLSSPNSGGSWDKFAATLMVQIRMGFCWLGCIGRFWAGLSWVFLGSRF
jgi:hypothetical protein